MTNYVTRKKSFLKPVIWGVITGTLLCTLFLVLTALLISKSGVFPQNFISPLTFAIAGVGCFVGGYVCGKISHENGMALGSFCGTIMFVMFLIGSFTIARDSITAATLIRLLVMTSSASIGGAIGVNKA